MKTRESGTRRKKLSCKEKNEENDCLSKLGSKNSVSKNEMRKNYCKLEH